MAKNKKKSKQHSQPNQKRKDALKKVEEWIKANFDNNTQNQLKALINKLNEENTIYLEHNLNYLTKDTFRDKISEILNEQNNKSQENKKEATGAKDMNKDNTPTPENKDNDDSWRFTREHKEFKDKYPDWADDVDKFKEYQKDSKAFDEKYQQEYDKSNSKNENNSENNNQTAILGEQKSEAIPTPEPENTPNKDKDWKTVEKYYNSIYKDGTVQTVLLDPDGVYIEVDDQEKDIDIDGKKEKQQLTGTAITYTSKNHVEIQKTKDGVEPKNQSFQHFQDHIAALKELGNTEITLGDIQSSKFCTKVVAAALANGIEANNITLKKGQKNHNLDFSAETLKEIPIETQTKLIEYALKNDVQIEFGENSPLLDFNNEAIQALPNELKIKYLCMLLANDKIKDKIKNAPKPIKLEALKERVIGKNADGSDITAGDVHDKINALRNRDEGGTRTFKDKDGQTKTIKTITKEQREANLAKLAQLRKNAQQNR